MTELNQIAKKILEKGKGILAADESTGTMTKRLEEVGVAAVFGSAFGYPQTFVSATQHPTIF